MNSESNATVFPDLEELDKTRKWGSKCRKASADLQLSLHRYKVWLYLGWSDIQQRYRGSVLGPFWITCSMIIFVSALGLVYSKLFHLNLKEFIPYLTGGILTWTFISQSIIESNDAFINAKTYIENIKLPFALYIFRLIWRNIIIFFHNFLVFFLVLLFFHTPITIYTILFIPGLLLVALNLVGICLFLSLLGTRFRDLPPIITSIVTVVFFVSPVTWKSSMLGSHSWIIKLNPISYYLDLVRDPLLGHAPMLMSWGVAMGLAIFIFCMAFVVFAVCRERIAFWL